MTEVAKFWTLDAFLGAAHDSPHQQHTRRGWSESTRDGVAYVRKGASPAEQEPVRALLAKVDAQVRGRVRPEWADSVAGARANVPALLAGHPLTMRKRQAVEHDAAPLRVYVETTVSEGTSTHCVQVRGAAVAALVMRLVEMRPVELWAVSSMDIRPDAFGGWRKRVDTVIAVRLNTTPLSASELTAVLVNQTFARNVMFAVATQMAGFNSEYISWGGGHDADGRMKFIRKELGADAKDILIPGGHLTQQDDIVADPVVWVNKQLDSQRE